MWRPLSLLCVLMSFLFWPWITWTMQSAVFSHSVQVRVEKNKIWIRFASCIVHQIPSHLLYSGMGLLIIPFSFRAVRAAMTGAQLIRLQFSGSVWTCNHCSRHGFLMHNYLMANRACFFYFHAPFSQTVCSLSLLGKIILKFSNLIF